MECKDYLVSHKNFSIQQCEQCGFRLTNPRPDGSSIGFYYKSDQYVSHNDQSKGLINTAYRLVRNYTLRSKLKLIKELNGKEGKLLDIGCGTGAFLEICRNNNWTIAGMEPDPDARTIAEAKLQIAIKTEIGELAGTGPFNIITLWHVLEHIPDLNKTISQLYDLLDRNGTLLIAVPNSASYDAEYFNEYWAAYDVPRHLYHFVPTTIEALFKKHGFRLAGTQPMLFDAFYIAMLSTKYQTGKTDYVKSIRLGLASNSKAKQTGNSSSLIYLFNKV
ncbi:class I SAM-dependent methyltransferase [Spirosoma sp. SC4-14]|uniref:class I SAM-dependent methyltransferase n=1 Tax=Spirosoma sp. SC4-14 TaxID=3128900 RepID=UPI0030CD8964